MGNLNKNYLYTIVAGVLFLIFGGRGIMKSCINKVDIQDSSVINSGISEVVSFLKDGKKIQEGINKVRQKMNQKEIEILDAHILETSMWINVRDPLKKENVDRYTYDGKELKGPDPVKLMGNGDLGENVFKDSEIKWEKIPDVRSDILTRAKDIEGAKLDEGTLIQRFNSFKNGTNSFEVEIRLTVRGTRENMDFIYNKNGEFVSGVKRR